MKPVTRALTQPAIVLTTLAAVAAVALIVLARRLRRHGSREVVHQTW